MALRIRQPLLTSPLISKSNSGGVTSSTTIPTSWASGSATAGRDLVLIISSSNIISATPTGWTKRLDAINNQDFKVYTRTADGTSTDTPTVAVGSCSARWLLLELFLTAGVDVAGTATADSFNSSSATIAATPSAGNRYALAIDTSQQGNAFNWAATVPAWTSSFIDSGLTTSQNGAGGVNDAHRISVGTKSAAMAASSQSTVASGVDSSHHAYGMLIFVAGTSSGGTTYNDTLTETAATSEAFTSLATFPNTLTETAATSEAATSVATFPNTLTETAATSEVFVGNVTNPLTETAATSEAYTSTVTFPNTRTETAATSETFVSTVTFPNTLTESAATSDSFVGAIAGATLAETAATSEAFTSVASFANAIAEAATTSEAYTATGGRVADTIEYLGGMPSGKRKRHPMDWTPRYVEEMRRQQEALTAPRKPLPPIPKPSAAQPVRAMEITANQAADEALAARRRRDEDALNVILALLDD